MNRTQVYEMIEKTIAVEGGWSDHPSDPGGKTKYGITEVTARDNGYEGSMEALTKEHALEIYFRKYWDLPNFDLVAAISRPIAEELFDSGVNVGPYLAARWLQEALNAFNRQGRDFPDLKADSKIGSATIKALVQFLDKRGAQGNLVMVRALNSLQGAHYLNIIERNARLEDFAFGWFLNRIS